jgi:hypothetical protein
MFDRMSGYQQKSCLDSSASKLQPRYTTDERNMRDLAHCWQYAAEPHIENRPQLLNPGLHGQ